MKKFGILFLLLAIFVALTVLVSCASEQGAQDTDSNGKESHREEATDESYFSFYPLDDGTLAIECNSDIIKYLTKIVIPAKHNGKIVSKIGENAFEDFTNIRTVVIPDSITEICYSAFNGCTNLINIEIPNSVTSIGNCAFVGCSNLKNIAIPNSVSFIGSSAFNGCSSLESITLPFLGNGIDQTHFGYIFGASSYSDNDWYVPTSLKSVTITGGTSIDNYAFNDCYMLTSITIPNSIVSVGDDAFSRCSNLKSIVIPNSVTSIGSYAFYGCSNLTIYCEAESQPSGWDYDWNADSLYSKRPVVWEYKG